MESTESSWSPKEFHEESADETHLTAVTSTDALNRTRVVKSRRNRRELRDRGL